jgi:hypothetical protein
VQWDGKFVLPKMSFVWEPRSVGRLSDIDVMYHHDAGRIDIGSLVDEIVQSIVQSHVRLVQSR